MYQGGQLDIGMTPYISKPGGVYDSSNLAKYFVEFYGAGHLACTNASAQGRSAKQISDYGIAFLDEFARRQASAAGGRLPVQTLAPIVFATCPPALWSSRFPPSAHGRLARAVPISQEPVRPVWRSPGWRPPTAFDWRRDP